MPATTLLPSVASCTPDYFSSHPKFRPNLQKPLLAEFSRLAHVQGWKNRRYQRERQKCLIAHFDKYLGEDADEALAGHRGGGAGQQLRLESWQNLCVELGLKVIPVSIKQCKKALSTQVHVNIIDLIDSRRMGTPVRTFKSSAQLQKYTEESGKRFPKARVKEDGMLKILLRSM